MKRKPTVVTEVPLLSRARHGGGVDWGKTIPVLCVRGTREMWQVFGCAHHSRMGYGGHMPGEVRLVENAEQHWKHYSMPMPKVIKDNARVSRKFFRDNAAVIDKFFGLSGLAQKLVPGRTIVITEVPRG